MARKTGRPPLDRNHPSVPICIKVPAHHYDQLWHAARRARTTVPELIRRKLRTTAQRESDLEKS